MLINRDAEINILDQTPMNCRLPNTPKPPTTENSSLGVAETHSWVQTPMHNVIFHRKEAMPSEFSPNNLLNPNYLRDNLVLTLYDSRNLGGNKSGMSF
jgi:hypothetical protein